MSDNMLREKIAKLAEDDFQSTYEFANDCGSSMIDDDHWERFAVSILALPEIANALKTYDDSRVPEIPRHGS